MSTGSEGPTSWDRMVWKQWAEELPDRLRPLGEQFAPWVLYRLKSTGQLATIYAFEEPEDPAAPPTIKVTVRHPLGLSEWDVFGIAPEDLEVHEEVALGWRNAIARHGRKTANDH